jgi:hypothetical protein
MSVTPIFTKEQLNIGNKICNSSVPLKNIVFLKERGETTKVL